MQCYQRLPADEVIKHIPGNGRFLYSAFSTFDNYDIIDYFEGLGVPLKEEDHGRMFPLSNKSSDVVNALLNQLDEWNVSVRKNTSVNTINFGDTYHEIILDDGTKLVTKAIVIAAGGKAVPHTGSTGDAYPWAQKAGHTITELYPTEVPIVSEEVFIKKKLLQGTALRNISLSVYDNKGKKVISHQMDMLFTHFGISGPVVLRCSQYIVKLLIKGQKNVRVSIDSIPAITVEKITNKIEKLMNENPKKTFKNITKGIVPERYLEFLLNKVDIPHNLKNANISKEKLEQFIENLKDFSFNVHGSLPLEKAFVTGGGISIKEVVPSTMKSKLMHGLYFCGEVLDIHGYTGGYNITAAMVTGRVAGMHAAWESISS
ncbi:dehydrogenases [Gracilibacillus boraciitolerans JCM 21714]|uniref:Dehydrogenases n=1 Tax=Gracilibacillus boraciitolerans JCM 21714 TaxID=1298598 RepID=W4VI86_9BACI|nr:dehydrogenases [Gracilibacillus boraciitolerans JCM 21714]